MLSDGILRQIILITDGHSNIGACPVEAAAKALQQGITVSAIGILDSGPMGTEGRLEVERIAAAGGGAAHFICSEKLAYTIHTVTMQATRQHVARLVGGQLQGNGRLGITGLPPRRRGLLIPLLEEIADRMELHVVMVVDTSGSMDKKRQELAGGIRDVLISLSSFSNEIKLAIVRFPAGEANSAVMKTFDADNARTAGILHTIRCGGQTPTGPAVNAAARLLHKEQQAAAGYSVGKQI